MFMWFVYMPLAFLVLASGEDGTFRPQPLQSFVNDYQEFVNQLKEYVTPRNLQAVIPTLHGYHTARPFPHAILRNIFPMNVLEAVERENADESPLQKELGCTAEGYCYDPSLGQAGKFGYRNLTQYGPATLSLLHFMQSSTFIHFLEELTGIQHLEADDTYAGAGIHQTLPGGFLKVHADFNLLPEKQLHRRVNVFLYLNPDWKEEYGGHLELWTSDLAYCEARIAPDIGTLVVFSTTDTSFHGHQEKLNCPQHRSRRSLALYFYTRTRPAEECADGDCGRPKSTQFRQTRCASCVDKACYRPAAAAPTEQQM